MLATIIQYAKEDQDNLTPAQKAYLKNIADKLKS